VGGSDQWGNITAGIELIRRVKGGGAEAHGLTFTLLTTTSGAKFGKTEAGAVWLDPESTSPYRFYQFWINTDDRDVGQMLRFFTLLDRERIETLDRATLEQPEGREAQRVLARDVTERVHGEHSLRAAEEVSGLLFGGADPKSLSLDALRQLEREIPVFTLAASGDVTVSDVVTAVSSGKDALFKSRGEARRTLEQGGLYINGDRVLSLDQGILADQFLHGQYLLVRKGGRAYGLVHLRG
jgi:tyrosyl-tRNA synthetase